MLHKGSRVHRYQLYIAHLKQGRHKATLSPPPRYGATIRHDNLDEKSYCVTG